MQGLRVQVRVQTSVRPNFGKLREITDENRFSWFANYARLRLFIIGIRYSRETQNPSEAIPWGFDSPSRHHLTYLFPICCRGGKCRKRIPPVQIRYTEHPAYFQYFTILEVWLGGTHLYMDCPYVRSIAECAADNVSANDARESFLHFLYLRLVDNS